MGGPPPAALISAYPHVSVRPYVRREQYAALDRHQESFAFMRGRVRVCDVCKGEGKETEWLVLILL